MAQKDEIDQLVGDEADTIIENCIKIESALAQALENVGQVGTSAAEYGSTLTRLSGEIDEDFSASEVRSFVSKLFSETQRMCERNRNLEAKLRESSGEINKLQENLANARIEALTDGLTGVANRKSFDSKLKALIVEGAEAGDRMSLLMIDIDHFKNFNDTHGHQLGDWASFETSRPCAHSGRQGPRHGGALRWRGIFDHIGADTPYRRGDCR